MSFDWWRRGRWAREMDAEFRFHLDNLVDTFMREGLSREDAERRARREFDPVELAKDESRDQRPVKVGARFSTNASAAPLWSSVMNVRTMCRASRSMTSLNEPRWAALRFFFM